MRIPTVLTKHIYVFSVDTRKFSEYLLLILSLLYSTTYLSPLNNLRLETINDWQAFGMMLLLYQCLCANPQSRGPVPRIPVGLVSYLDQQQLEEHGCTLSRPFE